MTFWQTRLWDLYREMDERLDTIFTLCDKYSLILQFRDRVVMLFQRKLTTGLSDQPMARP